MPAAAVIPAPLAYIKIVAVEKLVVGSLTGVDFIFVWNLNYELISVIRGMRSSVWHLAMLGTAEQEHNYFEERRAIKASKTSCI